MLWTSTGSGSFLTPVRDCWDTRPSRLSTTRSRVDVALQVTQLATPLLRLARSMAALFRATPALGENLIRKSTPTQRFTFAQKRIEAPHKRERELHLSGSRSPIAKSNFDQDCLR